MKFERFTVKSREAIADSQGLAGKYGNPEIRPHHLLLVLLTQDQGVVASLLQHIEADVAALTRLALARCRAPLVAHMESDDERPDARAFQHMLTALAAHPQWDGVACGVSLCGAAGRDGSRVGARPDSRRRARPRLKLMRPKVGRPGALGLSARSCTPGPRGDLARVRAGGRGGRPALHLTPRRVPSMAQGPGSRSYLLDAGAFGQSGNTRPPGDAPVLFSYIPRVLCPLQGGVIRPPPTGDQCVVAGGCACVIPVSSDARVPRTTLRRRRGRSPSTTNPRHQTEPTRSEAATGGLP